MLERGGKLVCRVVKNTSSEELTPHIRMVVSLTARIFTDEWGGYNEADKLYDRDFVDHGRKQYVKGDVHTNTVEGAWTLLKRSYMGTYHYMSRKHLQKYSNEFAFHYNTRNLIDEERFNLFLGNIGDYPTYKELAENNYEFDKKLVA
jgi:transposase-like protein